MPLCAGDRLGPYEILARIGEGGMGEVYRASDTRLNRDVAIKVSKEQFSERFAREAQAIAARFRCLNYCNANWNLYQPSRLQRASEPGRKSRCLPIELDLKVA